jgi:hypothetical protein
MTREEQIQQYLDRAREADVRASVMTDPGLKKDWLRLAVGYYDLAQMLTKSTLTEITLAQGSSPSPSPTSPTSPRH